MKTGSNNGDLKFDHFPVFLCKQTLTLSRLTLSAFLKLSLMIIGSFFLCVFFSHTHSFSCSSSLLPKSYNISLIAPGDKLLHETSVHVSGDKLGEYQSGESVTLHEVIALPVCVLYTFPPFLSHLYIPPLSFLVFTSLLTSATSVTGCSDIDNSVFEDLLNCGVYGSCLSAPLSTLRHVSVLRLIKTL